MMEYVVWIFLVYVDASINTSDILCHKYFLWIFRTTLDLCYFLNLYTDDLDNSLLKYIGLFSYQEIIFRLWICEWGGYFHITICNPFAMY